MKKILQRLIKYFAYMAAAVVILLAIAVGLFRLFLPRLPEYQEEIKSWASTAIGMEVEFSGMDARWGLSGPELEFYDAELTRPESGARLIAAEEVGVGVSLLQLLVDRTLIVDRVVVRRSGIDVQQLEDGSYRIQGNTLEELRDIRTPRSDASAQIELVGEDIELRLMQPGDQRPHFFVIPKVQLGIDDTRITFDADVRLPEELGRQLRVSALQVRSVAQADDRWDVTVDASDVLLAGWSELSKGSRTLAGGSGDVSLALSYAAGRVTNATADIDIVDAQLRPGSTIGVRGRFEYNSSSDGWLLAANDFAVATAEGEWPQSGWRVEAATDDVGKIVVLDAEASYLNLDDATAVQSWLTQQQQEWLAEFAPSGIVRDLAVTVANIGSDESGYNVVALLERVGVKSGGDRPGVRGFSGQIRADNATGRIEIDASDFSLQLPGWLPRDVQIRSAAGTVIWRNSLNHTTVFTDNIVIDSDFLYSESNGQLTLMKDGSSHEIDFQSNWSISDVAVAKLYIPQKGVAPKLYDWFQMALVSGSIPQGSTTLNGPLSSFPFDDGSGRLLVNASVENMTFKYHPDWPAAQQADLKVVVDNTRLYSVENQSTSLGNRVVDADIEIADLREPVFTMSALATGSLETVHAFSSQSPIAKVFGGQLSRVSVSGDASFTLDLEVPLRRERLQEFEFTSRIRSNNGTVAIEGFDPPITDLIGEVAISRESISSTALGALFLGRPVSIDLVRLADSDFSVQATVDGSIGHEGLVDELGAPLEGLVDGVTDYQARLLFPRGDADTPVPFTIEIESDLLGIDFDLPAPLDKAADSELQIAGKILFRPDGEGIETSGTAEDKLAWQMVFNRPEGFLDLDRGVVMLGDGDMQVADTRGLHIRGSADVVRLEDWLSLSRRAEKNVGAADRIRSIELEVANLYLIGQHLQDHTVRVDRSARDWLVQFDGDNILGSVFVPYDFAGDRSMVFDMQKMYLPGSDEASSEPAEIDPRTLPPIELTAEQFAFGERQIGQVEAKLAKIDDGLEATAIVAKDASFEITGTGRWVADEGDPLGSHSYVAATMASTDVKSSMARLGYDLGIDSAEMSMQFELDWSGSPRAEFFDVLNGNVQVSFGSGQLEEVEPGAGRMFGLMSIVALPRRLSLDFRDVFQKGFGFDEISGSFLIDSGKTYTCDLSLEGPAADIGIVGEADLANRTYAQTAVVSANVGNTLPIVGAVVAGPQVAAGLLIFSQIFKKPLQEVGQVYYDIGGSWDEPTVESGDSASFVRSGELASCLDDSQ